MAETELFWRLADMAIDAGDFWRARRIYEQGAALNDPSCWHGLGYMFDLGHGVEANKDRAMQCHKKAWRSKYVATANNIAILHKERGQSRTMFRWFERAARHGDDSAYLDLARCYKDEVGTRKSAIAAVRCLARVMAGPCASEADREEAKELFTASALEMPFAPQTDIGLVAESRSLSSRFDRDEVPNARTVECKLRSLGFSAASFPLRWH